MPVKALHATVEPRSVWSLSKGFNEWGGGDTSLGTGICEHQLESVSTISHCYAWVSLSDSVRKPPLCSCEQRQSSEIVQGPQEHLRGVGRANAVKANAVLRICCVCVITSASDPLCLLR